VDAQRHSTSFLMHITTSDKIQHGVGRHLEWSEMSSLCVQIQMAICSDPMTKHAYNGFLKSTMAAAEANSYQKRLKGFES